MTKMTNSHNLVNIPRLAEMLGATVRQVRNRLWRKTLPSPTHPVGKRWFYTHAESAEIVELDRRRAAVLSEHDQIVGRLMAVGA